MKLSLIVAAAENGAIGKDNALLWRLSSDLKRFKALTMGHPIIMGRKTFDSIGKPLPGRLSIVISRSETNFPEGVIAVNSVEEAIEKAAATGTEEAFVIGGGQIYAITEPIADKIYLTRVHTTLPADTFFEVSDPTSWTEVTNEKFAADEKHDYEYSFIDMVRNMI